MCFIDYEAHATFDVDLQFSVLIFVKIDLDFDLRFVCFIDYEAHTTSDVDFRFSVLIEMFVTTISSLSFRRGKVYWKVPRTVKSTTERSHLGLEFI